MPLRNYAIALAAGLSCGLGILTGNLAAQDHLGQYAQSDIVKGAQVYAAACSTCHGPNGNNIWTVEPRARPVQAGDVRRGLEAPDRCRHSERRDAAGAARRRRSHRDCGVRPLDPQTGDHKWKFPMTDVTDSGILTTGSDLLVTGGREGYFQALDARTGSLLWKANLGGQIVSGPMSYQVAGKIVRRTI